MKTKASFKDLVNGPMPVLIDFHATWCGPCKMLAPIVKEIASSLKGKLKVIKIDIDKNTALSGKLGIRGVPTLVLYQKGKIVWRQSGVMTAVQIKQAVAPFL